MSFNLANEILMRRIIAADPAIWAVVSQCARLSPVKTDEASLVNYEEIARRIGEPLVARDPATTDDVDLSWVTKSAAPKEVTDFPELKNHAT